MNTETLEKLSQLALEAFSEPVGSDCSTEIDQDPENHYSRVTIKSTRRHSQVDIIKLLESLARSGMVTEAIAVLLGAKMKVRVVVQIDNNSYVVQFNGS